MNGELSLVLILTAARSSLVNKHKKNKSDCSVCPMIIVCMGLCLCFDGRPQYSSLFLYLNVTVKPGLSVPLFVKHRLCVLFLPVFWYHDNNLHPITQVFQTRHVVFDLPYCLKVAKVLFCHIAERSFTSRLLY